VVGSPIESRAAATRRLTAGLLFAGATVFLVLAAGYNELLLGAVVELEARGVRGAIRWTQATFFLVGVLLGALGLRAWRPAASGGLAARPIVPKLLVACTVTLLPLGGLELMLRPFAGLGEEASAGAATTIFERDAALGWKLRPGARDVWGDVPVEINAKGLRGPELDYEKPAGVRRILYLGDSVTFGFKLASHAQTFPYLAEPILERGIGGEIETINAGVGGYSPWQQRRFLETEGIRYDPDLVVLCFVLNDVVEKFELARFGGSGRGYQLAHTARSWTERVLSHTAIGRFGMRWQARLRYGEDLPAGAAALETLEVQTLAVAPHNEKVRLAWEITLANVEEIVAFCESRKLPLIVVAFPYAFQFQNAELLAAPQRRLRQFASERGVPLIDLLPIFETRRKADRQETPEAFFLDWSHLSAEGHRMAAEAIAETLLHAGWR
jgi:lysophospholipase L1-like esterase